MVAASDGRHRISSYRLAREEKKQQHYFLASPGKRSPGRHQSKLPARRSSHRHSPERPSLTFSSNSSSANDNDNIDIPHTNDIRQLPSSGDEEGLLDRRDDNELIAFRERAPLEYTNEGEPICDYDTSATQLYELLESSAWEAARARCRSHPEEVRTWIVRKDAATTVRWKLLPLHASIIFQSPNYLVSAILEQYPAATQRKDDQQMLPLHLAFRHKHEDEDLLELLLVKYPKAVVLKDRRDRVPLEHARDAKFSAKLMRLYADAVTAASRLVGSAHAETPTTLYSQDTMLTAGERALLVKDHKDELLAVKQTFEKQIKQLKANTSDQVHTIEDDADKRIEMLRNDYETQIRNLKDHHESHLRKLNSTHQQKLTDIREETASELRRSDQEHADELQHLRKKLDEQVENDANLTETLERDIAELQIYLQESKVERDEAISETHEHQREIDRLCDLLDTIQTQHNGLSDMLQMQKKDHESAKQIRNELVQTLLRLEEQEGKGQHIVGMTDVIHNLRRKIDASLEASRKVVRSKASPRNSHHEVLGRKVSPTGRIFDDKEGSRPRQSSNMLAGRKLRDPTPTPMLHRRHRSPSGRSQSSVVKPKPSRLERAREELPTQLQPSGGVQDHWGRRVDKEVDDGDYGEVRILADEISAITDTSRY